MKSLLFALILSSQAQSPLTPMTLEEAQQKVNQPSPEISQVLSSTPDRYEFVGERGDSVAYIGQVMRQTLISDLKGTLGSLKSAQYLGDAGNAYNYLSSQYHFNSEVITPIALKAKFADGAPAQTIEFYYQDIYAKDISLQSKMAGVDNPLRHGQLLGWNSSDVNGITVDGSAKSMQATAADGVKTPDELMEAIIKAIAVRAATDSQFVSPSGELIDLAHITPSGLDLAQLGQKLLHGAVSFSQSAGDYLSIDMAEKSKGLLGSASLLEDRPYSALQHHWDEAWGYFGPARNYKEYSDEQIRHGLSIDAYEELEETDANGDLVFTQKYGSPDGLISLTHEKNFGLSINAAKRDLGAGGATDFTATVVDHLLKGRHLIQAQPAGYLEQAQAHATLALVEWEKVIAATTVHYINKTIKDYEQFGSADFDFKAMAKHYSEMKGFALAFQFNPQSPMPVEQFKMMHEFMGDTPKVLKGDQSTVIAELFRARDIIRDAYGFDQSVVAGW